MVAEFLMCTFYAFTYIIILHCHTWFDLLFSIIMNCVTYSVLYENLTCSISTRLISPGTTWKMDISGAGKLWKTHIKKVVESLGKPLSVFCVHPVIVVVQSLCER